MRLHLPSQHQQVPIGTLAFAHQHSDVQELKPTAQNLLLIFTFISFPFLCLHTKPNRACSRL